MLLHEFETQLNELSIVSDKNFKPAEGYKNYKLYVRKTPFNGYFIAVGLMGNTELKEKGANQIEALTNVKAKIDQVLNSTKATGASSIDFNVRFAKEILQTPDQPFFGKIENIDGQPKLVIAGDYFLESPAELAQMGFKRSHIRNAKAESEGTTRLPCIALSDKDVRRASLIPNGRYEIGAEHADEYGNREFDLIYHSTTQASNDSMRMKVPSLTVGTTRIAEDAPKLAKVRGYKDRNGVVKYEVVNSEGVTVIGGMSKDEARRYLLANRGSLNLNEEDDYHAEYEGDDEPDDQAEFYIALHDLGENSTFIGGVRNEDKWREFAVAGEPPYNWGSGYMSYLTPDQVFGMIHRDYERGYDIGGPFDSKQEARHWTEDNFGPVNEAATNKNEKKIETLNKQIDTLSGRLGMAKDKRRMKGDRLLSSAELKIMTKISNLRSQVSLLQQSLKESCSKKKGVSIATESIEPDESTDSLFKLFSSFTSSNNIKAGDKVSFIELSAWHVGGYSNKMIYIDGFVNPRRVEMISPEHLHFTGGETWPTHESVFSQSKLIRQTRVFKDPELARQCLAALTLFGDKHGEWTIENSIDSSNIEEAIDMTEELERIHCENFHELALRNKGLYESHEVISSKELISFLSNNRTTKGEVGSAYIYCLVFAHPFASMISISYFDKPHKLLGKQSSSYTFEVDGKSRRFLDSNKVGDELIKYTLLFDSSEKFAQFLNMFVLKYGENKILQKKLDQSVDEPITEYHTAGTPGSEYNRYPSEEKIDRRRLEAAARRKFGNDQGKIQRWVEMTLATNKRRTSESIVKTMLGHARNGEAKQVAECIKKLKPYLNKSIVESIDNANRITKRNAV